MGSSSKRPNDNDELLDLESKNAPSDKIKSMKSTQAIQGNTFQPAIPQGVLLGNMPLKKPITIRNRVSGPYTADGSSASSNNLRPQHTDSLQKKRALTLHKPIKMLKMKQKHFEAWEKQQEQSTQSPGGCPLTKQYTLVLDLDETLIHSTFNRTEKNSESVYISGFGVNERIFFQRRPYLEEFLQEMSKIFNLVVFTASQPEYADPVLDLIDNQNLIARRFYRDSCSKTVEGYIKCLDLLDVDLSKVILVDNAEISGAFNRDNLLLIKPWYSDEKDDELLKIASKLKMLENEINDLRTVIKTLMTTE